MKLGVVILSAALLLPGTRAVFAHPAAELPKAELPKVELSAGLSMPEPALNKSAFDKSIGKADTVSSFTSEKLKDLEEALPFLRSYGITGYPVSVEYAPSMTLAAAGTSDANSIPPGIRNNRYFIESVRLANLAQQSYDEGDYDGSSRYSEEAIRYANLSDEYVRLQLKIKETDDAIAAARRRLDFANSVNAISRYPSEHSRAQAAFNEARAFRAAESWDEAIEAANRVLVALVNVSSETPEPVEEGPPPLPAQYTVRPWSVSRDCFWNIAGRTWVYNDPQKWRILYEANRTRLPEPDNPDLIHPGMVLDIPSIRGETRQGMWDSSKAYSPLP